MKKIHHLDKKKENDKARKEGIRMRQTIINSTKRYVRACILLSVTERNHYNKSY
jgi:hypothetical protein